MAKSDKKVKTFKVEEVIPVINEEKSSSEHFLVIWEESGDETHFLLLPMSDFESVTKIVKKISERKISSKEIITLVDSIKTKSITDIFIFLLKENPQIFSLCGWISITPYILKIIKSFNKYLVKKWFLIKNDF